MPRAQRPVRLAGQELRDRHIALLTDGRDDGYEILGPFIADGFAAGDRAFHIVDPASRDDHLARLGAMGIDVTGATASHQLEVRTWDETYLDGGAFDRARQVGFVRRVLREGRTLGFPATRLIGSLDWAVDRQDALSDVSAYEGDIDSLLRPMPDVVVCTYDLSRHSARAIADILAFHPAAVVGGAVRTSGSADTEAPRDRILTAASRLFGEAGIQATGVDAIIMAARVAKATFYRHFPSKDDLVIAWLRDPRTRWFDRVRVRAEEEATDPGDAVLRLFEAVADWLAAEDYRGCPYLNSAVEIADPADPARLVITDYLQEIEDHIAAQIASAGFREPRRLAAELQGLMAGAISLGVARRSRAPALASRDAARVLLAEAATTPGSTPRPARRRAPR